jgi:hypothetical protein
MHFLAKQHLNGHPQQHRCLSRSIHSNPEGDTMKKTSRIALSLAGILLTTAAVSQSVSQGIPISELTEVQPYQILYDALLSANEQLKGENVSVLFKDHIPQQPVASGIDCSRNILLGIQKDGREELIDIVYMKSLDENFIKPVDVLAEEIVRKVKQHLLAKQAEGILFSASGSKFDPRKLTKNTFGIDQEGYIRVNNNRVAYLTGEGYRVIKAEVLRSYTITRLIEEGEIIRFFDDYDPVRRNNRGMFIDPTKLQQLVHTQLDEGSRKDAKNYDGGYVLIGRDELTIETKQRLQKILPSFQP